MGDGSPDEKIVSEMKCTWLGVPESFRRNGCWFLFPFPRFHADFASIVNIKTISTDKQHVETFVNIKNRTDELHRLDRHETVRPCFLFDLVKVCKNGIEIADIAAVWGALEHSVIHGVTGPQSQRPLFASREVPFQKFHRLHKYNFAIH